MSTASTVPNFGRRWKLEILTTPENGSQVIWTLGQDAWLPEGLRVTFDINQQGYKALWWADIALYNLNLGTQEAVIQNGYQVRLSAGYQAGDNYGVIFTGEIFQSIYTRENVVDEVLTLHCMGGKGILIDNLVSYQAPAGSTQRDIVMNMAATAHKPIPLASLDSTALDAVKLPRGEIVFGSAHAYLSQVAKGFGLQFWHNGEQAVLGDMTPTETTPRYTYSSVPDPSNTNSRQSGVSYTIIGTPEQIPEGVHMRVLLDSRLLIQAPAMLFKIDNTVIRQMAVSIPTLAPLLTKDGVYIVGMLRHHGDTRGNEWYTDVTGISSVGGLIAVLETEKSLQK